MFSVFAAEEQGKAWKGFKELTRLRLGLGKHARITQHPTNSLRQPSCLNCRHPTKLHGAIRAGSSFYGEEQDPESSRSLKHLSNPFPADVTFPVLSPCTSHLGAHGVNFTGTGSLVADWRRARSEEVQASPSAFPQSIPHPVPGMGWQGSLRALLSPGS